MSNIYERFFQNGLIRGLAKHGFKLAPERPKEFAWFSFNDSLESNIYTDVWGSCRFTMSGRFQNLYLTSINGELVAVGINGLSTIPATVGGYNVYDDGRWVSYTFKGFAPPVDEYTKNGITIYPSANGHPFMNRQVVGSSYYLNCIEAYDELINWLTTIEPQFADIRNWDWANMNATSMSYDRANNANIIDLKTSSSNYERLYVSRAVKANKKYTFEFDLCSPTGYSFYSAYESIVCGYIADHVSEAAFTHRGMMLSWTDTFDTKASETYKHYSCSYTPTKDMTLYFTINFTDVKDNDAFKFNIKNIKITEY